MPEAKTYAEICNNIVVLRRRQELWQITRYLWDSRRPAILVMFLALLAIPIFLLASEQFSLPDLLWKKFAADEVGLFIQVITFLAVAGIWFIELKKEWRGSLEKYLSVSFVYEGQKRIRCRYAPLVTESDIRNMAQSFGQALNKGGRLPIAPAIQGKRVMVEQDRGPDKNTLLNGGKPFLHYDVTLRLTRNIPERKEDLHGLDLPEGQCLLWTYPFDPPTEENIVEQNDDRCN